MMKFLNRMKSKMAHKMSTENGKPVPENEEEQERESEE